MTYLDKLIDAAEGGTVGKTICFAICDVAPEKHNNVQTAECVWRAFHGYLDAAKALHDALLPGWGYRVSPCYAAVMHPSVTGNDVTKDAVVNDNPARAWLLAILKAYREETQK